MEETYALGWPGKGRAYALHRSPPASVLVEDPAAGKDAAEARNLLIEGENLEVLKLLQATHQGRVKLIYIDPPYNTGSALLYGDRFSDASVRGPAGVVASHAGWLSMIYPRLLLARTLLSEDGAIAVHIDENEYANLEKVLAEVFGEANSLGTIVWDKRNPKGDSARVAQQHEYISIYAKNAKVFKDRVDFRRDKPNAERMLGKAAALVTQHGISEKARQAYRAWLADQPFSGGEKAYALLDDAGEVFRTVSMAWPNRKPAPASYFLPLVHPVSGKPCPVPKKGWRNSPETMRDLMARGQIVFGPDETTQPTRKYLLRENMRERVPSLLYHAGSDDLLLERMGLEFHNPKPMAVACQIIQSIASGEDIVLDFFAGSGTTGHAVMEINALRGSALRFILVQQAEEIQDPGIRSRTGCATVFDLCRARIARAPDHLSPAVRRDCVLGTGFRVWRLRPAGGLAS